MNRLEQNHLDFLRTCAAKPNSIHALPENVLAIDADAMATEGLLVKYSKPTGRFYAIGRYGAQYVKESMGPSDEMKALATEYVVSKDYDADIAAAIVEREGVESILKTRSDEMRHESQREVTVPMNEQGKPEMKFKG